MHKTRTTRSTASRNWIPTRTPTGRRTYLLQPAAVPPQCTTWWHTYTLVKTWQPSKYNQHFEHTWYAQKQRIQALQWDLHLVSATDLYKYTCYVFQFGVPEFVILSWSKSAAPILNLNCVCVFYHFHNNYMPQSLQQCTDVLGVDSVLLVFYLTYTSTRGRLETKLMDLFLYETCKE